MIALLSCVLFVIGRVLESRYGGIASSLCAILISGANWYGHTQDALAAFMVYLFLDMSWRTAADPLPTDILVHHILSFFVTAYGFYASCILVGEERAHLLFVASQLLAMEGTSPLLHLGKALKVAGKSELLGAAFIALIVSWIPMRIRGPLRALVACVRFFPRWHGVHAGILALSVLQFVWLARLVALARRSLAHKTTHKTNGSTVCVGRSRDEGCVLKETTPRSHEA